MGTFGCPSSFMAFDLFDFQHAVSAPFRMQPGLRRLAPGAAQLTPNEPGSRHLLEKLSALGSAPHSVLLQRPSFDPLPALQALARHAAAEQPETLHLAGDGLLSACRLGWSVDGRGEVRQDHADALAAVGPCVQALAPAWRPAALLALAFAEDFAIIDGSDASIPWLAVALPSHWSPAQKVGRHFAEVHAPVADNRLLITAGEHLMRLVTREERWERFVWNITRHPALNNHPDQLDPTPWRDDASAEAIATLACFRTERQTFIPVPGQGQAVFTIHVESQPLPQAITTPAQAAALHDALATMSPAVLAYRSLGAVQARLLAWLAAVAGRP